MKLEDLKIQYDNLQKNMVQRSWIQYIMEDV